MKKYKVTIEGKNYLLSVDGQNQRLGFFTVRWVVAASVKEAEKAAVELIANDPKLLANVLNEQNDPPKMYAKEIEEVVDYKEEPEQVPGFVFYPEEKEYH